MQNLRQIEQFQLNSSVFGSKLRNGRSAGLFCKPKTKCCTEVQEITDFYQNNLHKILFITLIRSYF